MLINIFHTFNKSSHGEQIEISKAFKKKAVEIIPEQSMQINQFPKLF